MSFANLGLSQGLLEAVAKEGYTEPTPIQAKAIPAVLEGHDLLAAAQTGTGKTAAFTLPLLHKLSAAIGDSTVQTRRHVRVLVLVPTRELAAQVADSVRTYGRNLPSIRTAVIFGGVNINPQIDMLRRGVDIVVATPGRLLDHVGQRTADLSKVEVLVLDEADRMLDMGFIHDIKRVIGLLPKQRQNLLFSATFSPDIRKLAEGLLKNPVSIDIAPRNSAAESVGQRVIHVAKDQKAGLLAYMVSRGNWKQTLVFTRTKHGANRLAERLAKDGITTAAIHGNKSQGARTRALADFKTGAVRVLVATDIAARGLDIDQLPHVVNYELPNVPEDYVHRIGRTGRAGASGEAISLVSGDERGELKDIERLLKKPIPVFEVEGYTPTEPLRDLPRPPMRSAPRKPQGHHQPARSGERKHSGGGAPGGHRGKGGGGGGGRPPQRSAPRGGQGRKGR
ncbi:MAG: DEAD/DEAH box helicase [Nevskiaceae bacterium]|nr:MAG: DEAD/DEAH box helicase [Nevskiaceae bacterium]